MVFIFSQHLFILHHLQRRTSRHEGEGDVLALVTQAHLTQARGVRSLCKDLRQSYSQPLLNQERLVISLREHEDLSPWSLDIRGCGGGRRILEDLTMGKLVLVSSTLPLVSLSLTAET